MGEVDRPLTAVIEGRVAKGVLSEKRSAVSTERRSMARSVVSSPDSLRTISTLAGRYRLAGQ